MAEGNVYCEWCGDPATHSVRFRHYYEKEDQEVPADRQLSPLCPGCHQEFWDGMARHCPEPVIGHQSE